MYPGEFAKLRDIEDADNVKIPENIPILPLRDFVVFPHMVSPLIIARAKSLKMIEELCGHDELKWKEVADCSQIALQQRIALWDCITDQIKNNTKVLT